MSKKGRNQTNPAYTLTEDFAEFLKGNKLDIYSKAFAKEGVFSLNDFRMLSSEDIESIVPVVDGKGYRKRLRIAFAELCAAEQKDEESEPPQGQRPPRKAPKRERGGESTTGRDRSRAKGQRSSKAKVELEKKDSSEGDSDSESEESESAGLISYVLVILLMVTLVGLAVFQDDHLGTLSKQVGLGKGYPSRKIWRDMSKFYRFYLHEHKDTTNQMLHAVGTALVTLVMLFSPSLILSSVIGLCAGLVVMPFCVGFSSGIVEGLVMVSMSQLTAYALNRWRLCMLCLVIGYGLAWTGHFQFEHNQPATFQAPTFSLLSDYLLAANYWREVFITKQFPLLTRVTLKKSLVTPKYFEPLLNSLRALVLG